MRIRLLAWAVVLLASSSLARAADPPQWQGTWAATSGSAKFAGTWDAAPGKAPNTAGGNWALLDPDGRELATGTWAAVKEGKLWRGTWQARRPSGEIYDGTWQAQAELAANSHFAALFEAAIAGAVNGNWRMGAHAGAWSIRAYSEK